MHAAFICMFRFGHVSGFIGVLSAFSVAYKQLYPQKSLRVAGYVIESRVCLYEAISHKAICLQDVFRLIWHGKESVLYLFFDLFLTLFSLSLHPFGLAMCLLSVSILSTRSFFP